MEAAWEAARGPTDQAMVPSLAVGQCSAMQTEATSLTAAERVQDSTQSTPCSGTPLVGPAAAENKGTDRVQVSMEQPAQSSGATLAEPAAASGEKEDEATDTAQTADRQVSTEQLSQCSGATLAEPAAASGEKQNDAFARLPKPARCKHCNARLVEGKCVFCKDVDVATDAVLTA